MTVMRNGIVTFDINDRFGFGAVLNADGSLASIIGPTTQRVTASPDGGTTANRGSLAQSEDGILYINYTGSNRWARVGGPIYQSVASSAVITNSNVETAFSTGTFQWPADALVAGSTIRARLWGSCPSTNAADTLTVRLRLGGAGITGQIVAQTLAVDVANNDVFVIDAAITVQSVGAAGDVAGSSMWALGAQDNATFRPHLMPAASVNTTLTNNIVATAQWSVADAANQVQLDGMMVYRQ